MFVNIGSLLVNFEISSNYSSLANGPASTVDAKQSVLAIAMNYSFFHFSIPSFFLRGYTCESPHQIYPLNLITS